MLCNIGPDTGSPENAANIAHQLFFSLDIYRQKTKRNFQARVGIHSDFVRSSTEDIDVHNQWTLMCMFNFFNCLVNTAHKLVSLHLMND